MKLTFIGAAHEVTGSCHYLEACGKHILIDCGLEQGPDLYENQEIPINPSMIDYILLTHAHIDHSGKIPLLVKNGFKGEIICTFATSDLCSIMLRDSAHIQESEAAEIPEAIRKGKEDAMKKLIKVTLDENDSITHDYIGKFGSASVLLKKAPEGTGVIAGGPARAASNRKSALPSFAAS